jgi:hypothetical protein
MAKFPAQKVQCPHCAWQGSARGLFTHVRLGHPDKDTSSVRTKGKTFKRSITIDNPHAIGSVTKAIQGKLPERVTDPFKPEIGDYSQRKTLYKRPELRYCGALLLDLLNALLRKICLYLHLAVFPRRRGKNSLRMA